MTPTPLKEEGTSTNDGRDSATSADVVVNNNNGSVTPSPKPAVSSPPSLETPEQLAIRRRNQPLTNIMEPGPNDCLFGRGGGTNHHPGNKLYRQKVDDNKHKYLTSKRLDKPLVAMQIITEWRSMHPPGRFLKQDDGTKLWNDVGDKKAREKTSQALREKTPVKSRDDGNAGGSGAPGGGGSGGSGLNHRARFEPGLSSPRPNTISKGVLARDHSLGETGFGEDVNLEGFSWDDTGDDAAVVVQHSDANVGGEGRRREEAEQYPPPPRSREPQFREQYPHHYPTQQPQYQERGGGSPSHQYYPPQQQQQYPPHPEEQYPYHREHSLSNNPLSDASVAHSAQPSAFGERPPPPGGYYGHPYPPPPYESYPGHHPPPPPYHHPHHYPPHGYSSYGGPPPPSSSAQQHHYHHQQQQRAREHSLQSNPLSGASTTQPARDTFNDEESTSHASSSAAAAAYDDRMPPLPSPTYDSRGPPPPPPPSYYQGGYEYTSPRSPHGWPAPPPPHHAAGEATPVTATATAPSPQFSYNLSPLHAKKGNGSSAFGKYESSESSTARNSMQSLGSSVDGFYDRRDSRSSASAAAAAATTNNKSVSSHSTSSNGAKNTTNNTNNVENPSSAGTSQDYSKIAELIRDSSDKTAGGGSSIIERSNSMDVSVAKSNEGGLYNDDGIQRSKSDVGAMSSTLSVAKDEDGNELPRNPTSTQPSSSSLMKKLSGGGMAISNAAPPNGIHRPNPMNPSDAATTTGAVVLRPDPVKRDTSNQPETLETKRSVKRVVLGRDQSAVARRLKEEQYAAQQTRMQSQHGVTGRPLPMGVRASSRLSKAELLDRKLSVEINKLGLEDINENSKLAKAALHPGLSMTMVGIAPLDRMTTEDVLASLIDDEGLDDTMLGSPSPTLTEAIAEGQLDGQSANNSTAAPSSSLLASPQLMSERVTTIDAIAMDIANGNNSGTDNWDGGLDLIDEDTVPSGMTSPGVNADIAEKWLKGET